MVKINGVMIQYFHWYLPGDGSLWNQLKNNAQELADAGITALWLPPAYKGTGGGMDVGYGVYDIYDLGEFNQKGSIRTKYGTRQQYLDAIKSLHKSEIEVYADTVLNHKIGADGSEIAKATPFPNNNRKNPKGDLRDIKAYTLFNFPGRKGKYSTFEWHWWHFDAVDYDEFSKESGNVYLFEGKTFDDYVALENGNFAYLMGADLDFQNEEVRKEISNWTKWYLDTTGVDGFRLDAIKHISAWFFPEWLDEIEKHTGRQFFTVGEYWSPDSSVLNWYLDTVGDRMSVFDVSLHYNFHYASKAGGYHDMRTILDGTLVKDRAMNAVTFVENHDSQPLQALESVVEPWFKPIAYAIILLRQQGYPCIFHADYTGQNMKIKDGMGIPIKLFYLPVNSLLISVFMRVKISLTAPNMTILITPILLVGLV